MLETGYLLDGKYRILKVIGSGGMSVVYLALNERANKYWAVKELKQDPYTDTKVGRHSLMAELELLKKTRHPCLPEIVDVIERADSLLIVMDYIEGKTLQDLLKESGPPGQDRVLDWARQLCDVLLYLHSREPPVIYRDLKPANIMLTPEGRLVLIDFGTALEMKAGRGGDELCLGTRGYASPEQYGGSGRADIRSDIYCFGVTLHHLLTGCPPPGPPGRLKPLRQIDPSLEEGLESVILRCVREDPKERYQNCRDLLYDLEHHHILRLSYKKEMRKRFRIFILFCCLTLLFGLASWLSGTYYHHLLMEEYGVYLEEARQATSLKSMETAIHKAVALNRGEPAAYQTMLSWMTTDGIFTDEEKASMETILYEKRKGSSNINEFRKHRKGYEAFSYDMGLACFFYYKGSRGKDIARLWFEDLDQSSLPEDKKVRASIYAGIGSYYSTLKNVEGHGENSGAGYTAFFHDLSALNTFTPDDIGNAVTAAALYCEIAEQIGENAGDFISKGDGITPYLLRVEIGKIKDYRGYKLMKSCSKEIKDRLDRNIEDAWIKIAAAARQGEKNFKEGAICRIYPYL